MKKLKYLVVVFFFIITLSTGVQAQKPFYVGQMDVNVGVGFGTQWISNGYYTLIPPLSVSFDYGMREDIGPGIIGIGAYIGASSYRFEFPNTDYGFTYNTAIIMGRASYHYCFANRLDTYGGIGIGFRLVGNSIYGTYPALFEPPADDSFVPAVNIYVGSKYYFSPSIAAFAEVGYGLTYFTLGATFKIIR